ncbi:MAG: cytochrome P450, partial [Solirubrobacteraceae bacterium]|nr:cytochrome P450 [Solirubrobacteraceae bacterium]
MSTATAATPLARLRRKRPQTFEGLPPGPTTPGILQTAGVLLHQREYMARNRAKYGPIFALDIAGFKRLVVVSDIDLIKQVFKEDPTVLHAGDQSPLRRILGQHSMLGIDEGIHLEQRKLLLPPFKGQRMKAYESTIRELAIEQIDRFPIGTPHAVSDAMQTITLRAILSAVFGATGRDFDELEELLPPLTEQGSKLSIFPQLHVDLGPLSPWGRFIRLRGRVNVILDRLIATAKADPNLDERPDILASLVQATHTDGTPMENAEIRDQLVTMLAAGHETTAHQLSWAVERLARNPEPLAKLVA